MFQKDIKYHGRLALFELDYLGRRVATASGYLLLEEGQARLYIVSFWEARFVPPRRVGHVAVALFAKALGATHLVPVDHGMSLSPGRVRPRAFDGGFVPCLPAATLEQLEHKVAVFTL